MSTFTVVGLGASVEVETEETDMAAQSQVSFEKVDIGGGPVDFPPGATHWHEVEVYEEEGTVLVGFEHHVSDDTDDERGGFA